MIVPRRLCTTQERQPWEIVEADDPRAAFIFVGPGTELTDAEAEALGLTAYLAAYDAAHTPTPEAKMVQQAEVEDKAVAGPAEAKADEPPAEEAPPEGDQPPGVRYPPESRRLRGR
jgi:hypothetical protein